jgi:hypothetical protein
MSRRLGLWVTVLALPLAASGGPVDQILARFRREGMSREEADVLRGRDAEPVLGRGRGRGR